MSFLDELTGTQQLILGCALVVLVIAVILYFTRRSAPVVSVIDLGPDPRQNRGKGPQGASQQGPPPSAANAASAAPPKQAGDLVCFKADYCGHCKNLAPVWAEFMQNYDGMNGIRILTIDGQQNPDLAKLHNIQGYPSIKYCPYGVENPEGVMYQGDRSLPSLVEFMKQL